MSDEKAALLGKKKELQGRMSRIHKDLGHELSADFAEQATELENRDVLLEIARVTEAELEALNKKIQQLDEN